MDNRLHNLRSLALTIYDKSSQSLKASPELWFEIMATIRTAAFGQLAILETMMPDDRQDNEED